MARRLCPNMNHRRRDSPVAFCPDCGEVVNVEIPRRSCKEDSHVKQRRGRSHHLQELMGPIVDRSREQLGPADRAIIVARQLLAKAVETVADGGDAPGTQRSLSDLRAADVELSIDGNWRESLVPRMDPAAKRV